MNLKPTYKVVPHLINVELNSRIEYLKNGINGLSWKANIHNKQKNSRNL